MPKNLQVNFFLTKLNDDLNSLSKDVHDIPSADKAFSTWSLMLIENATLVRSAKLKKAGQRLGFEASFAAQWNFVFRTLTNE